MCVGEDFIMPLASFSSQDNRRDQAIPMSFKEYQEERFCWATLIQQIAKTKFLGFPF